MLGHIESCNYFEGMKVHTENCGDTFDIFKVISGRNADVIALLYVYVTRLSLGQANLA